jgi:hypothetical protein
MDGPQFDAWTRRRFGLAAGSLLAGLLCAVRIEDAAAGKKRRKRCRKLGRSCKPGGKRKCCGQLRCRATAANSGTHTTCCKTEGKPCNPDDPFQCCGNTCCAGSPPVCSSICPSDRALKTNFGSVDAADMLERVRSLPISTWNYTSDDPSIRHIGAMAQDFTATFGVGADDRHIHPIDGQGVALAAIQGLLTQIEEMRQENAQLAARIAALEKGAQ